MTPVSAGKRVVCFPAMSQPSRAFKDTCYTDVVMENL